MNIFKSLYNTFKPDTWEDYDNVKDNLKYEKNRIIDELPAPEIVKDILKDPPKPLINPKKSPISEQRPWDPEEPLDIFFENLPLKAKKESFKVSFGNIILSPIAAGEFHVGICDGDKIIEMTKKGIKKSSKSGFTSGLLTNDIYTFASKNVPLGFKNTSRNANNVYNKFESYDQSYDLLLNNCIKFVVYCITNDLYNNATTFNDLVEVVKEHCPNEADDINIVIAKLSY